MINALEKVLDTTSTYLLGYKIETVKPQITTFADVAAILFDLEKVAGLKFDIDVKRPPRNDNWECSLKFDGKAKTDLNAYMCLFLEDWADMHGENPEQYEDWKDKTLAYYSILPVSAKPKMQTEDNAITKKVVPSIELQDI